MSEATTLIDRFERSGSGSRAHLAAFCAAALATASVLGGCASEPKPTAQLVHAKTLVGAAEKAEAQRYAPADLQRARDELSDAQTAESHQKYRDARRLADRAAADADLASARAASGKAQQSAAQVRHSLDTLRQQLQQSGGSSGGDAGGAGGSGQDHP